MGSCLCVSTIPCCHYRVLTPAVFFFREKKKEKEREDLWKRLAAVELNPPVDKDPHILSKTPLTNFTVKRESPVGHGLVAASNSAGDKSPGSGKR